MCVIHVHLSFLCKHILTLLESGTREVIKFDDCEEGSIGIVLGYSERDLEFNKILLSFELSNFLA